MDFIEAKTIMTKVKNGDSWYGVDFNMNLYRGCSHGCIYCDSRSDCYKIEGFDRVRSKKDALLILERELQKSKKTGVIGIGAMSDTYNHAEKKYEITRGALKLIKKYGYGVSIDTKSDLVLRDLDILKEINKSNNVIVKITITTPNDELSKNIEPYAPVSSQRFKAIKELNGAGIYAGIMLNPVLPFVTDNEEDIKKLVYLAHINGAKFIHTYMGMTLRDRQRDYYLEKIDELFPGMMQKYFKCYQERYDCTVLSAKHLYGVFVDECKKYGILYNMKDIIKAYKVKKSDEQISLF
ncbi:MAG: radical SAM protein [Bacilli bacterium]|nr:radical SAM protein [Bacilli bacterium]